MAPEYFIFHRLLDLAAFVLFRSGCVLGYVSESWEIRLSHTLKRWYIIHCLPPVVTDTHTHTHTHHLALTYCAVLKNFRGSEGERSHTPSWGH